MTIPESTTLAPNPFEVRNTPEVPNLALGGPQYLGQGLQNLGGSLANIAIKLKSQAKKAKQLDDTRWVLETFSEFARTYSDFTSNTENKEKNTYPGDSLKYGETLTDNFLKKAPSPEAAEMFKQDARNHITQFYENANDYTSRLKTEKQIGVIGASIQDMLLDFRNNDDPSNKSMILISRRKVIERSIDDSFGDIAPKLAMSLKNDLDMETATALKEIDIPLLKRFLSAPNSITERQRENILDEVTRLEKTNNLLVQDSFKRVREINLVDAERNRNFIKIPLERYLEVYDTQRAQVEKNEDDRRIDAFHGAHELIDKVSGINAEAQMQWVGDYETQQMNPEEYAIFNQLVRPTIAANIELQEKDPVDWLLQSNDAVHQAAVNVTYAPGMSRGPASVTRDAMILKYQGVPGPGDNHDEFLNRALLDMHLLTQAEADDFGIRINKSSPDGVVSIIQEILNSHPVSEHKYVVFRDLANMPRGDNAVKPEYQLIFNAINEDGSVPWWLDSYVSALKGKDYLKNLSIEEKQNLDLAISGNKIWQQFKAAYVSNDPSRYETLGGFEHGIEIYAQLLMDHQKLTADKSVAIATSRLIGEQLAFTENLNGSILMMSRKQGGNIITDDMARAVGDKLSHIVDKLDLSQIDSSKFNTPSEKTFYDDLMGTCFWQTSADMQSFILYAHDDLGFAFEITDKKKKPIQLFISDLPFYEFIREPPITVPVSLGAEIPFEMTIIPGTERLRKVGALAPRRSNFPIK